MRNVKFDSTTLKVRKSRALNDTPSHLPYGITQCYLSPDTSEHTPP